MISNTDKKIKQLTNTGKILPLILYNMFLGFPSKGSVFGRTTVLGKAFGLT